MIGAISSRRSSAAVEQLGLGLAGEEGGDDVVGLVERLDRLGALVTFMANWIQSLSGQLRSQPPSSQIHSISRWVNGPIDGPNRTTVVTWPSRQGWMSRSVKGGSFVPPDTR